MWPFSRGTRAARKRRDDQSTPAEVTTPTSTTPPRRGISQVLDAYRDQPWYHAALDRIATSVVSVPFEVRAPLRMSDDVRAVQFGTHDPYVRSARTGEWATITDHAILRLLRYGSPQIHGRATLKLALIHYLSVGEAFLAIARTARGLPAELWIMPPQWVQGTPSKQQPYFTINNNSGSHRFAPEDVIWIRNHDAKEPYQRGSGTGFSLGDELDTDEYAADFTKKFFLNGAAPGIIASFEDMEKPELREAKRALNAGHRGHKKSWVPFVTNRKASITVVQHDLEKMGLRSLREFHRNTVMQTHGLPPEILGILDGSNRATISAADHIMAKHVTVPLLEVFIEAFQYGLADILGAAVLCYVNPIPEDAEFQLKAMIGFPNCFLKNEVRKLAGLDPIPEFRGQEAGDAPRQGGAPDGTDPDAPNAPVSGTGEAQTVDP